MSDCSKPEGCTCYWFNKHERRHRAGCPVHLPSIPKIALKDFYELRTIIESIQGNQMQDVNNPMQADKRNDLVEAGISICNKWININPPFMDKN